MSTNTGNKEVEYTEAFAQFRYFHDYRNKIFNFLVVFNGVTLTVVISLQDSLGQAVLSAFAALTSTIMLLAEVRAIAIADNYRVSILRIEEQLGFSVMKANRGLLAERGWQLKIYYRAFYALIIIAWALMFAFVTVTN